MVINGIAYLIIMGIWEHISIINGNMEILMGLNGHMGQL